jgi:TRAP-type C4-dicarboxylate transport system substrate-binding protein
MNRFSVLAPLLAFALAFLGGTAGAETLKIATLAPDGTSVTTSLREGAKEVESATQGRVQVKIYAGGVMGSDAQVMRKMRAGQLQAATLSAGSLEQVDFSFGIIGMPMLVTTPAQADAARAAVEPELLRRMKAKGLDCTGLIEVGFIHVMGEVPVHGPADMTRIKPWLPEGSQLGQDAFSAFGVTPIPLPLPDVLTGLQTGVIDTVVSSPVAALALQWFTRIKHIMDEPLLYSYSTLAFQDRALAKLTDADRKTVMDIFTRRMSEVDKSVRLENDAALQALLAQGITLEPVTPEGHARFKAVADELVERYRDEGKLDPALLEKVRAAIRAVN